MVCCFTKYYKTLNKLSGTTWVKIVYLSSTIGSSASHSRMMNFQRVLTWAILPLIATCCLLAPPAYCASLKFVSESNRTSTPKCPCSNPKWCDPITDTTRKEVFAFSLDNNPNNWKYYDWTKVTTLVMFGYINQDLMCLAHSHGARVAFLGQVSRDIFMSPEKRQEWINQNIQVARSNFLDGINFDYESPILQNETDIRDAYTALVRETNDAFKKALPYFQVTVDVAWKPNIDLRYYDYVGLAENSDFLFMMMYDEQSQIFGECVAGPNSGLTRAFEGIESYVRFQRKRISVDKLVMGVPWYGYWYPCVKFGQGMDVCQIKPVPFRGVNCSDAAGSQISYAAMVKTFPLLSMSWNGTSFTPFYTYTNLTNSITYQVQYDNPMSLGLKYKMARDFNLRGVGMWNIDYLDYSDTVEGKMMRDTFFDLLPSIHEFERRKEVVEDIESSIESQSDFQDVEESKRYNSH